MTNIAVRKRDGSLEDFNIEKIHKVLEWAVDGLADVSVSDIAMNAKLNLHDGIKSSEIHETLIASAKNLISIDQPNYSKVAARLLNYLLRKKVWGGRNAPKLLDLVNKNIASGHYSKDLIEKYSEDDFHKIDEFIDHSRDEYFEYAGLQQLIDKYLVQDRGLKTIKETPQFAYALIAMTLFGEENNGHRKRLVRDAYNAFSKHKINLSTPIMAGARTNTKSFASCCTIDIDDTKNSLFSSNTAVGMATCHKYGIGLNMSKLRGINSPIRNGETLHTGVIPWLKMYQATINSCQQGGARRGAGTVTFPIFHYEIENILQLKNNTGTEENRVRHMDYSIAISKLFYQKFLDDEQITLFSYHECPELFDMYGSKGWDALYLSAESNKKIKFKKKVSARKVFASLIKERVETGRIYIFNIDEANAYSAWDELVQFSNLCQEFFSPTVPMQGVNDEKSEIGICVLSAINMLKIDSDADHKRTCEIVIRLLDNLIDVQDYFDDGAKRFSVNKRSLGVGITNYAAWLASKGLNHESDETPNVTDEFLEKQQYYLLSASCKIAKEKGKCNDFASSKYSRMIFPLDRYNKNVDSIVSRGPSMDWSLLKSKVKKHGLRNCTVSMCMPAESSSIIQGSTNGIEPIRGLITYKKSKTGTLPVLAPSVKKWKNKYSKAFEMQNNDGIIRCVSVITKWMDMGVSGNLYSKAGEISQTEVIKDILSATKNGWRTFYYHNTDDGDNQEVVEAVNCVGGACSL